MLLTDDSKAAAVSAYGPSFYILNPTSLAKFNAFQLLVADVNLYKFDIVVICESWLKNTILILCLNWIIIYYSGVIVLNVKEEVICVHVNNNFTVHQIGLPVISNSDKFETVWLRVQVYSNMTFILCCLYHPLKCSFTPYTVQESRVCT